MFVLNEDVDTTWAFIRMIEHWNETEWWRPFNQRGVSGEVSTFGKVRNCSHGVYIRANRPDPRPYFSSTDFPVYRAVLGAFIKQPHQNAMCDHIDRDSLNTSLSNLRWVSASMNQRNKTKDLVSGTGVEIKVGKRGRTSYRVRISLHNVKIGLGTFYSMEEADARYKRAVRDAWEILDEY